METATSNANAALIATTYEAFAGGDVQGVLAFFADDILWHVPGRGPLSGDYRGRAQVASFFQRFMELSRGTFRIAVADIFANEHKVVVLVTESAERGSASGVRRRCMCGR